MEQYAETQDLVIWTSSTLESRPKYDPNARRWELVVNRNGIPVPLRPAHLVMALGILGDPVIPSLPGASLFKGAVLHSGAFPGGEPFAGQRVVVVGAGASATDVCQDLVVRGAKSVTLVQRSASAVVSDKYLAASFGRSFPAESRPIYYSDLAFAGLPIGAMRELGKKVQPFAEKFDRELHEGLTKAGFKLTAGPDSSGQLLMVFDRFGVKDVVMWNSIITGYAQHGLGEEALRVFQEMCSSMTPPDEVTFVGVLSACSYTGKVNEGLEIFDSMKIKYLVEPQTEHYACLVDLLG